VLLNNSQEIGLEMQVVNLGNWTDRSLSYLCRTYDSLYKGQNYNEANPVVHIGFLDFTLFADYPEFYATYKMMNIKNYHIYSDKLQLGVVN
jgi:predicted transposase/invertase (TIGR01784 family)